MIDSYDVISISSQALNHHLNIVKNISIKISQSSSAIERYSKSFSINKAEEAQPGQQHPLASNSIEDNSPGQKGASDIAAFSSSQIDEYIAELTSAELKYKTIADVVSREYALLSLAIGGRQ